VLVGVGGGGGSVVGGGAVVSVLVGEGVKVSLGSGVQLGVKVPEGVIDGVREGVMEGVWVGVKVGKRVGMTWIGVLVLSGVGAGVSVLSREMVGVGLTRWLTETNT
jgi:hypothetical protein